MQVVDHLVLSIHARCKKLKSDWYQYLALRKSNIRLLTYLNWLDNLDMDSLSQEEYEKFNAERESILSLHREGKDFDDIIKRRLKWIRAQRG